MDDPRDKRISPPPEPEYVRRSRNLRAAWNELYPVVLSVGLIGVLITLAVLPSLRDPSFLSVIATALIGVGSYTIRRRSR